MLRATLLIVLAAMAAATLISVAFGGDDAPSPRVVVEWIDGDNGTAPPDATPTASEPVTTPPSGTPTPASVRGLAYPIEGACLPQDDNLMPGAPREYREGTHEGLDFYDFDNCAFIGIDSEVLAAAAGQVVRADVDYAELTPERLAELEALVAAGEGDDPDVLDAFRGRQVWIDHGDGIVTRYAHLDAIAEGIVAGARVEQGELIGYVGDSGSPEAVTEPGTQVHLHFEVRVGDTYLGAGLSPEAVRALYEQAFTP